MLTHVKIKLRLSNSAKLHERLKMFSKTPLRSFDGDRKADWILVRESEFSLVNPEAEFNERRSELRVDEEVGRGPEEAVAGLEPQLLGGTVAHPAIRFTSPNLEFLLLNVKNNFFDIFTVFKL